jgi:surface polysaccharide O-acyltransferase-like enzyme
MSGLLKLSLKDLAKGFLIAVIMAFVTTLYQLIQAGNFDLTWLYFKPIVFASLGAGLSYLIKNLFSNSDGQFLTKEK